MAEAERIFDEVRSDNSFNIAQCLQSAKTTMGKSYFAVVKEIFKLSRGIGKIEPQEYVFYRLYDDNAFSESEKASFLGHQAMKAFDSQTLKNAWTHVSADKLVLGGLLIGVGLPTPKTFALYHPFRCFGDVPCLRDANALADFLRSDARYPFFSKPIAGVNSLGVVPVESYDAGNDSLRLKNGREVPVEQFVSEIGRYFKAGYCFQERIEPHSELQRLCGPRMSSFRVFVIFGEDGPEVLRASWKISTGDHPADNFWRRGNLLAPIDVETGTVQRVVQGAGPECEERQDHPDTGETLNGITVPHWSDIVETVSRGAASLPNCLVQGWDVTLTDDGPVLIELEGDGGHPQMIQFPQGRGLYEGRFRAFHEQHTARAEAAAKAAKQSKRQQKKAAA